jgi:hypothetical protein
MTRYPEFKIPDEDISTIDTEIKKLQQIKSEKEAENKRLKKEKVVVTNLQHEPLDDKKLKPMQFLENIDINKNASRWTKIKNWWKLRKISRAILINMEMKNGNHRSFVAHTSSSGFEYNKRRYLFDNESSYYNVDFGLWCFDYHEDMTIPVKRTIPVLEIKDSVTANNKQIEHAINPATIEEFIVSEVAKGIMQGQAIGEFLRQARMLWIISLIVGVIDLLVLLWHSGVFDKIKGG